MKKIYTFLIALFFVGGAMGQSDEPCESCLPDGIEFTTQAQIDNFQTNYPNCTEIEGSVIINGNDIVNLSGLNVLTSINGGLTIGDEQSWFNGNPRLQTLAGLHNLTFIGGGLAISGNDSLVDLSAVSNLYSLGSGALWIIRNNSIADLSGLNTITDCLGLRIIQNPSLTNLEGLENITTIGDFGLTIENNENLLNLTGLEGLTQIQSYNSAFGITIEDNPSLISLEGLNNLISVNSGIEIIDNHNLQDLSGLENLSLLEGDLIIKENYDLINIEALSNLETIQGSLVIGGNSVLLNLEGLNGLTSISGNLNIGYYYYLFGYGNPSLNSLEALSNLISIGGGLHIIFNSSLNSLSGLDNIASGTITDLHIQYNPLLSTCDVQSICDYLVAPSGIVEIHDNAIGCNSPEEVLDSCEAHTGIIDVLSMVDGFLIYPNPATSTLTIELPIQPSKNTFLTISNINGQQLITKAITEPQTEIDISHLPVGIYIVKVWNDNNVMVRKVMKQ